MWRALGGLYGWLLEIEMPNTGVVFLMYHELEMAGRSLRKTEAGYVRYMVPVDRFRAQMELLAKQDRKGVSVGDAVRSLGNNDTVAITFDDGAETDLLFAAPILREFGFGATFYITTGWSGRTSFLTYAQIQELSSQGFEIGSHSITHPYLSDLDDAELRREMTDSKRQLEDIIGKPVEHFSCPGGRFDHRAEEIARDAGYRTVCTSEIHLNTPATNLFGLGRIAVMRHTSLHEFEDLLNGSGMWRRRTGARVRSAVKKALGNSVYDRVRKSLLRTPPSS